MSKIALISHVEALEFAKAEMPKQLGVGCVWTFGAPYDEFDEQGFQIVHVPFTYVFEGESFRGSWGIWRESDGIRGEW